MKSTFVETSIDAVRQKLAKKPMLSTISFVDGTLVYHVWEKNRLTNLKVRLKGNKTKTVSDVAPNAALYEREIHEFYGTVFEGNQDHSRVFTKQRAKTGRSLIRI